MNDTFTFETEPFMQNSFGTPNLREFENEQSDFAMEEELRRGQRSPGRPMPPRSRPSGSNRYAGRKPPRPSPYRPRRPVIGPSFTHSEPAAIAGSEYVRWIQHCLNQAMNFHLPVTGVMSPETRSAIRSFQKQQGLAVTGIAGPETKDALKAACGRRPAESEEFEIPAAGIVDPELQTALSAGGLESAEVLDPINRAITAINQRKIPDHPRNPRHEAMNAIDEALKGLNNIPIQASRQLDAMTIRTEVDRIRRLLTAARRLLDFPRGATIAQSSHGWGRASDMLRYARREWEAFLRKHPSDRETELNILPGGWIPPNDPILRNLEEALLAIRGAQHSEQKQPWDYRRRVRDAIQRASNALVRIPRPDFDTTSIQKHLSNATYLLTRFGDSPAMGTFIERARESTQHAVNQRRRSLGLPPLGDAELLFEVGNRSDSGKYRPYRRSG